jgi:hypothetical protein
VKDFSTGVQTKVSRAELAGVLSAPSGQWSVGARKENV